MIYSCYLNFFHPDSIWLAGDKNSLGMKHIKLINLLMMRIIVSSGALPQTDQPNIVLLLADDMGWTAPACYGSDTHETPNIDRLSMQGIKFTNAYAACPVCSPTRASIVTGKYPARLHLTDWIASTRDMRQ